MSEIVCELPGDYEIVGPSKKATWFALLIIVDAIFIGLLVICFRNKNLFASGVLIGAFFLNFLFLGLKLRKSVVAKGMPRLTVNEPNQTVVVENMQMVKSFWSNPPVEKLILRFSDIRYFYTFRTERGGQFGWPQSIVLITSHGDLVISSEFSNYDELLSILTRSCKKTFSQPEVIIVAVVMFAAVLFICWFVVIKLGISW